MHRTRIVNPITLEHFYADQAAKFGFLAGPHLNGQFWFLEPGQEVVGHFLPDSDQIYITLQGDGVFRSYQPDAFAPDALYAPNPLRKVDPPPKAPNPSADLYDERQIKSQDVFLVQSGILHSIHNVGGTRMLLVSVTSHAAGEAVYISR